MRSIMDRLFKITPLGRADTQLKASLQEVDEEALKEYEKAVARYRFSWSVHNVVKVLFYAGVITSAAATIGFDSVEYIAVIASYIGVSILLVLYGISYYFLQAYKEEYYVRQTLLATKK